MSLTPYNIHKMVGNSEMIFSNKFSWTRNFLMIQISLKCILKGPIDIESSLVRV